MARLRSPEGCPWDREQTFDTIKPYLLEETYEVMDSIDARDWEGLADELGDLLLQVVFFSQMAKEAGYFDITVPSRRSTVSWSAVIRTYSAMAMRKPPTTSFASGTRSRPTEKAAKREAQRASRRCPAQPPCPDGS